jgi:hypothetical protein
VQENPAIEGLLKAIKLGHRDAFIIYEVFLRDDPRLVYGLNRTIIDLLANYVMQVHAER